MHRELGLVIDVSFLLPPISLKKYYYGEKVLFSQMSNATIYAKEHFL